MRRPHVPVTLLTGFLGAGKTTLLNAVLSDSSNGRVAVIVNEFGEAGLDHDLIAGGDEEEIVLMESGCLCCTVRGELSGTIANLWARRSQGKIDFDRIVIETTGIAEPGPILQTLRVDDYLSRAVRMDGVVTVVDAANGPATLDAQFEAVNQVAMADLLIISKADLVPAEDIPRLEARLRGINPTARMIRSMKGSGIAGEIWGLSALRPDAGSQDVLNWTMPVETQEDPLANLSGLGSPKPAMVGIPVHDTRINSQTIMLEKPIPGDVFDEWLDNLMKLRGRDILRIKGIVFLEGIKDPFVFHGVQHVFDPPVQLRDWPGEDRTSRIVVIARDLSLKKLQRSLNWLRESAKPSLKLNREASP